MALPIAGVFTRFPLVAAQRNKVKITDIKAMQISRIAGNRLLRGFKPFIDNQVDISTPIWQLPADSRASERSPITPRIGDPQLLSLRKPVGERLPRSDGRLKSAGGSQRLSHGPDGAGVGL